MTIDHPAHHGHMSASISGACDEIIDRSGAIEVVWDEGVERGIVTPDSFTGGLVGGLDALVV